MFIKKEADFLDFKLVSPFKPTGDQPQAIEKLVEGIERGDRELPIDIYDMVTWMAISVLSEQSMATGASVPFPDFTNGKWVYRKNNFAK